jgi:hypothetical protein
LKSAQNALLQLAELEQARKEVQSKPTQRADRTSPFVNENANPPEATGTASIRS